MIEKSMYREIESLYKCFEDERSKQIFMSRLQYSLTRDAKNLISVVMPYFCCNGKKWNDAKEFIDYIAKRKVVIFGAGGQGIKLLEIMNALDIHVSCICDNSSEKWGQIIEEKIIISPEELVKEYKDAVIIVATYEFQGAILEQLRKLEFEMNQVVCFDDNGNKQYFDRNIFKEVKEKEVFIDGGCFNGANSLDFCEWAKESEKQIYAFEPDCKNLIHCQNNMQLNAGDAKYEMINAGLWSESTTLTFARCGNSGSHISDEGDVKVEVASIDDIVGEDTVTFIKMDIEGAELEAIKGATKTILKNKPKMAICLYHKPEDIVDIPLYIKQLVPEYKFWLRHYSLCAYETVLYALCD